MIRLHFEWSYCTLCDQALLWVIFDNCLSTTTTFVNRLRCGLIDALLSVWDGLWRICQELEVSHGVDRQLACPSCLCCLLVTGLDAWLPTSRLEWTVITVGSSDHVRMKWGMAVVLVLVQTQGRLIPDAGCEAHRHCSPPSCRIARPACFFTLIISISNWQDPSAWKVKKKKNSICCDKTRHAYATKQLLSNSWTAKN